MPKSPTQPNTRSKQEVDEAYERWSEKRYPSRDEETPFRPSFKVSHRLNIVKDSACRSAEELRKLEGRNGRIIFTHEFDIRKLVVETFVYEKGELQDYEYADHSCRQAKDY